MYQIRIRTNKRLDEYGHHDRINVGVRLRNGDFTYLKWRGFTLDMDQPVKLLIEAYSLDSNWDPWGVGSKNSANKNDAGYSDRCQSAKEIDCSRRNIIIHKRINKMRETYR